MTEFSDVIIPLKGYYHGPRLSVANCLLKASHLVIIPLLPSGICSRCVTNCKTGQVPQRKK